MNQIDNNDHSVHLNASIDGNNEHNKNNCEQEDDCEFDDNVEIIHIEKTMMPKTKLKNAMMMTTSTTLTLTMNITKWWLKKSEKWKQWQQKQKTIWTMQ